MPAVKPQQCLLVSGLGVVPIALCPCQVRSWMRPSGREADVEVRVRDTLREMLELG